MFLALFNFLRGFVKIEIRGFSAYRFINQSTKHGALFWGMERIDGKLFAYTPYRHYLELLKTCEKTGSKLDLIKVFGMPALIARLRQRLFLFFGGILFVAFLIFLTSFVWRIDVEGVNRINASEMLSFLDENDLHIGRFRHSINYREIERRLMLEFDEIAWVSITLRGTRALISVVEIIHEPALQKAESLELADIVATTDGIIVYMATSAGQPLFRPGDVVATGDVIVAGRLQVGSAEEGNLSYRYVHAQSEVWARVYHTLEFEVPLTFYEKTFTGQSSRKYAFQIGTRQFNLPFTFGTNAQFLYYEVVDSLWQASFGASYPLPLARTRTNTYELARHLKTRTLDEATLLAQMFAEHRIQEEIAQTADILDKQISFTENERDLSVQVSLITIQRIDQPRQLIPQEEIVDES